MLEVATIGVGATLCIDLWVLFLKSAFRVSSLDYCLLGRWLLHMTEGRFAHQNIVASSTRPHECKVGWTAHYSIGVAFTVLFVLLMPIEWLEKPTLLPALAFGIVTVVVPFFTLQPALGLGIAGARTPRPVVTRLKSTMTHAVFGVGLYVWARLLGHA